MVCCCNCQKVREGILSQGPAPPLLENLISLDKQILAFIICGYNKSGNAFLMQANWDFLEAGARGFGEQAQLGRFKQGAWSGP